MSEAADVWAALSSRARPKKRVSFPAVGDGGQALRDVDMQVLTGTEKMVAQAEATRYARALVRENLKAGDVFRQDEHVEGYRQVYENAVACEILFRAIRKVDAPTQPVFPTAKALRDALTLDEIGVLFDQYAQVQIELGPILQEMAPEDLDAWMARIEEGGRATLAFLSREALIDLSIGLVSRRATSPTGSSSPGSSPGEPGSALESEGTATDLPQTE